MESMWCGHCKREPDENCVNCGFYKDIRPKYIFDIPIEHAEINETFNCEDIIHRIIRVVNHGSGEGFIITTDYDKNIYVFSLQEGGFSFDYVCISEILTELILRSCG